MKYTDITLGILLLTLTIFTNIRINNIIDWQIKYDSTHTILIVHETDAGVLREETQNKIWGKKD